MSGARGHPRWNRLERQRILTPMKITTIARRLSREMTELRFSAPVTHVYNPLDYAWASHRDYLQRFGDGPKEALFLGMNPGPFGMVQTGVPFGEIAAVRDWLGIERKVKKPRVEHPKRPILGFGCPRSEVSGRRLWNWAAEHAGTPEQFFKRFFVYNYCPLAFLEETGRNFTPDKLPAAERAALFDRCDRALRDSVKSLGVDTVVGIGAFAARRARQVLDGVEIHTILDPSPASPLANKGWAHQADKQLLDAGIGLEF